MPKKLAQSRKRIDFRIPAASTAPRRLRRTHGAAGRGQEAAEVPTALALRLFHSGPGSTPADADSHRPVAHLHRPLRAVRGVRDEAPVGLGRQLPGRETLRVKYFTVPCVINRRSDLFQLYGRW